MNPNGQQESLLAHFGSFDLLANVLMGALRFVSGFCAPTSHVIGRIASHELLLGQHMTVELPAKATHVLPDSQQKASDNPWEAQDCSPSAAHFSLRAKMVGEDDAMAAKRSSRRETGNRAMISGQTFEYGVLCYATEGRSSRRELG